MVLSGFLHGDSRKVIQLVKMRCLMKGTKKLFHLESAYVLYILGYRILKHQGWIQDFVRGVQPPRSYRMFYNTKIKVNANFRTYLLS